MEKLESVVEKTKAVMKKGVIVGATIAVLYGFFNGAGTILPNKYNSFGGEYNRPCAAFQTNEVRRVALEKQKELFKTIQEYAKDLKINYFQ